MKEQWDKLTKQGKIIVVFLLLIVIATIIGWLFPSTAQAGCNRCELPKPIIIEQTTIEQTTIEQSIQNEVDRSQAKGIANNHKFNLAIPDLQWSTGFAYDEGVWAGSFSIGKKDKNGFWHGSITMEEEQDIEDAAYFVGRSGRF